MKPSIARKTSELRDCSHGNHGLPAGRIERRNEQQRQLMEDAQGSFLGHPITTALKVWSGCRRMWVFRRLTTEVKIACDVSLFSMSGGTINLQLDVGSSCLEGPPSTETGFFSRAQRVLKPDMGLTRLHCRQRCAFRKGSLRVGSPLMTQM